MNQIIDLPATPVGGLPGSTALTVGVEEEFLLLDPLTGENLPLGQHVIAALPDQERAQSRWELRRSMVEMVSPVCGDLAGLHTHLSTLRRAAASAGADLGARLVAIGATPVREPQCPVASKQRYLEMTHRYGPLALDPAVCGCHVHVGVPERELAVQVCNHLRGWLPLLQALAANSPLADGTDTGYASWRSVQLRRWTSIGPTPHFTCADDYDQAVAALVASGAILDEAMIYWYARPSARYPTVEVRVADVCPTVEDTVLLAGLVRALVATAVDNVRAGVPAPRTRTCLLTAAHWRAAHDGLEGALVDPHTGSLRPAWDLLEEMLAMLRPALRRHGDLDIVAGQIARVRRLGSGAARQRRTYRLTGDIHAVLAELAEQTAGAGD